MPKDGLTSNSAFAEWLNVELRRRRMTQNQLEKELKASGGVVSRWARGIAAPAPKFVYAIAELWSVDVDWLLTLTGYRPNVEMREDVSSPRANIARLIETIELTPERTILLTSMLENMRTVDEGSTRSTPDLHLVGSA